MADSTLPPDFLATPAEGITAEKIDFAKTDLPKYAGLYAVILDSVLTANECETLVKAAETTTNGEWARAKINIGGGKERLMEFERCCGRIIWDSQDVVDRIWKRIKHLDEVKEILRLEKVPRIFGNGPAKRDEVWVFNRPNERMRFLKYTGGEYFRPHCDGTYETEDRSARSHFTLHLYLNNGTPQSNGDLKQQSSNSENGDVLIGGATTFHSYNMKDRLDVVPVTGRILLFQHRDLLHSGDDVVQGVKYTMRTDLLYSLEAGDGAQPSQGSSENAHGGAKGEQIDTDAAKKARAKFGL